MRIKSYYYVLTYLQPTICPVATMKIKCQQFNYVGIVWVVRQIFCTPSVPSDINYTGLNSVCYACAMMHETQYCMVRIFPYRSTAPFTSTCTLKRGVAQAYTRYLEFTTTRARATNGQYRSIRGSYCILKLNFELLLRACIIGSKGNVINKRK